MEISRVTTENANDGSHGMKTRATRWNSNPTTGYLSKGHEVSITKRCLHYVFA